MSKKEAIKHLRDALRMANLPIPSNPRDTYEKDAQGNITAANRSFCVGYMEACIKEALEALGETVE
jgi:hypothetical protein